MAIDLRKVNHVKRQSRFYLIQVGENLFGQGVVIREWGRIGQGGQVATSIYDNLDIADHAAQQLKRAKERKGYVTLPQQIEMF